MSDTIEVFISYSKQDKALRDGLLTHLRSLEGKSIITWHDRQILPGTQWDAEIKARLNAADIILLLISADFLATDYCTQVEIPEALRRHEAGEAIVMPVILRSCTWDLTPLAAIQAYPEKATPVVRWTHMDDAYTDVVRNVHLAATKIKERRSQKLASLNLLPPIAPPPGVARINFAKLEAALKAGNWREADQLPPIAPPPGVVRRNYAQLEAALKAGNWREADQETARRMYQVMGRQKEGWLTVGDVEKFLCADLRAIDQLWAQYSKGKFGFSAQKKIWQRCGSSKAPNYEEKWEKFGVAVGWRSKRLMGMGKGEWIETFSQLNFNTSAKTGHLPLGVKVIQVFDKHEILGKPGSRRMDKIFPSRKYFWTSLFAREDV